MFLTDLSSYEEICSFFFHFPSAQWIRYDNSLRYMTLGWTFTCLMLILLDTPNLRNAILVANDYGDEWFLWGVGQEPTGCWACPCLCLSRQDCGEMESMIDSDHSSMWINSGPQQYRPIVSRLAIACRSSLALQGFSAQSHRHNCLSSSQEHLGQSRTKSDNFRVWLLQLLW